MLGVAITSMVLIGFVIIFLVWVLFKKVKNYYQVISLSKLVTEFKKNQFEFSDILKTQNVSELYDKIVLLNEKLLIHLNYYSRDGVILTKELFEELDKLYKNLNDRIAYFHYINKFIMDGDIEKKPALGIACTTHIYEPGSEDLRLNIAV